MHRCEREICIFLTKAQVCGGHEKRNRADTDGPACDLDAQAVLVPELGVPGGHMWQHKGQGN